MSSSGKRFRLSNRLKRPEEFKKVFASKRRSSDKFFLILASYNSLNRARLGLAVPKKHIPAAVERNRLKRIIREHFRLNQEKLKGNDIVVVVRNKVAANINDIETVLIRHLNKII